MSDALRERMREDLHGSFRGRLHLDTVTRQLYSTDASIFQVSPFIVAVPMDEADVQTIVRYANQENLSIVARGAGTGLAGESLGPGIILDLSVHCRQILGFQGNRVRVQPGVVLRDLNRYLADYGQRFAPDPATAHVCTIGGMIANNSSGSRLFRHGYTRDYLQQLRVVWDTGDSCTIGREPTLVSEEILPWMELNDTEVKEHASHPRTRAIVRGLTDLIRKHQNMIDVMHSRTVYNRLGYQLHDILHGDTLDLARFFAGSEGTLGILTEAELRTIPLPGGRVAVLLALGELDGAFAIAELARDRLAVACEILDRRLLALARTHAIEQTRNVPHQAETLLLIEFEGESPTVARTMLDDLLSAAKALPYPPLVVEIAQGAEAVDELWQLRETVLPSLYSLGGGPRPQAFIEDIAVPVDQMPRFLTHVQDLLQRFETSASFLVHALTGQIHIRPFLDLTRAMDREKLWPIAQRVYEKVWALGGTISTQHAVGIARTPWVIEQAGPLLPLFREVKSIFDPHDRLNPGKIVGLDPSRPAWPLRAMPTVDPRPEATPLPMALNWSAETMVAEINRCTSCGDCRTQAPTERMCPTFRVEAHEMNTPRAKANLARDLLTRDGAQISDPRVRETAETCINCRMCVSECSAKINIPKLMIEIRAAHQREHGLERADWLLARIEHFASFSSNFALGINALLRYPPVRWVIEQLFGISRKRRLPAFAERSFLRIAQRKGWTRRARADQRESSLPLEGRLEAMMQGAESRVAQFESEFDRLRRGGTRIPPTVTTPQKVAYFVDVYANYNDPTIGIAVVEVLKHQGIEVYVPPQQRGCGIAPYAQGDIESAREIALHNVRLFADLVREGYQIVCSEPTAALMLRDDYLDLVDDPDAKLVADHTIELTALLHELERQGRLRTDFQPLDLAVGRHVPCHLKALHGPNAGSRLMAMIPQLRVFTIDVSCSGMAGTFGMKAANYAVSLAAGEPMLAELRRPRVLYGASECSACRMQMEEGSGKRALHPIQYLAMAYGFLPELARRLRQPLRPLLN